MTKSKNTALLILRLITAVIFVQAAYAKLIFWSGTPEGMPAGVAAIMKLLSIVEPLGATAVLVGFLTPSAARGLAIILVGAIYLTQFIIQIGFATPTEPGRKFSFPVH